MYINKLSPEFKRFFLVGISTVLIDFISYNIFVEFTKTSFSKAISFLIGSIFAYFANSLFTFKSKNKSIKQITKFFIFYFCSLILNVSINGYFVSLFLGNKFGLFLAFLIAVTFSVIFNFVTIKNFVFNQSS